MSAILVTRRLRRLMAAATFAALLAGCGAGDGPAPPAPGPAAASAAGGYPVTGDIEGVHDPSMVRSPDGTYLLFSTGDNLEIRSSKDRLHWTVLGSVWPNGAPWTEPFTAPTDRSALWAPDISYHDGSYYLYYAASSFGSRHSAIFLATSPDGRPGSFTDRGLVWQTDNDAAYNAIDPNLVVDAGGAWWLDFGSFWSGLKLIRLDPATGKPAGGATQKPADLATRPQDVEGAIEAPYIVANGGYYYLFSAFDFCCRGTKSTYRTMVGRSTSITGPYLDRDGRKLLDGGGTQVLASHDAIIGPGHPAVLKDGDAWLLIYHYYYSDATPATGKLGIAPLTWVDGWPQVG